MAQVQPYVKSHNEVSIPDVAGLLAMLERAFGDPDKKATAQRELRSLRQANKEFHVYLSDFQRMPRVAEATDYRGGSRKQQQKVRAMIKLIQWQATND